ncbi:hypothetical protein L1887_15813 [Cichorium endivia]|nr:hypothetical protein L1887_15813 [Cichorium endivia]
MNDQSRIGWSLIGLQSATKPGVDKRPAAAADCDQAGADQLRDQVGDRSTTSMLTYLISNRDQAEARSKTSQS